MKTRLPLKNIGRSIFRSSRIYGLLEIFVQSKWTIFSESSTPMNQSRRSKNWPPKKSSANRRNPELSTEFRQDLSIIEIEFLCGIQTTRKLIGSGDITQKKLKEVIEEEIVQQPEKRKENMIILELVNSKLATFFFSKFWRPYLFQKFLKITLAPMGL